MTFLRGYDRIIRTVHDLPWISDRDIPSLVMNEMNSLTHSCMHSLASFAIFAFSGRAVFMIRATGAKLRILASEWPRSYFSPLEAPRVSGDWEEVWDMIGCMTTVAPLDWSVCAPSSWLVQWRGHARVIGVIDEAIPVTNNFDIGNHTSSILGRWMTKKNH